MMVAAKTAPIKGPSRPALCLPITLSTRNFVEIGSTIPQTRLMTINRNPNASRRRLGRTSSLSSGRTLRRCSEGFPLGLAGDTMSSLHRPLAEPFEQQLRNLVRMTHAQHWKTSRAAGGQSGLRILHYQRGPRAQPFRCQEVRVGRGFLPLDVV